MTHEMQSRPWIPGGKKENGRSKTMQMFLSFYSKQFWSDSLAILEPT